MAISLSRFYKRLDDAQLIEAIVNRSEKLTIDDLVTLQAILPTKEERETMALFQGNASQLNRAERFMHEALREPNLAWMVDSLLFERQFETELENYRSKRTLIISLLTRLRESPALKTLLKLILELGNLANYDYGRTKGQARVRGKALGFTMDSLVKLGEVKSVDRKTTLLHYLTQLLADKHPHILNLPEEFAELSVVRHWDTQSLTLQLQEQLAALERLRNTRPETTSIALENFRVAQQPFLQQATAALEACCGLESNFKLIWNSLSEYFGEDPNERRPEDLFMLFDQFFRNLRDAHTANQKQQQQQQKISISRSSSPQSLLPPSTSRGAGSDSDTLSVTGLSLTDPPLLRSESNLSLPSTIPQQPN